MNVQTRPPVLGLDVRREAPSAAGRTVWIGRDRRRASWMVAAVFLVLLVPAAFGRLSGWRWQPWPPGRKGYRSLVAEAWEAAETYVTLAFLGW